MLVRKPARGPFLALLFLVLSIGPVFSHSGLLKTEPLAGSRLKRAPVEVKLLFSERLEVAFSSVQVKDTQGHQVDLKDTRLDTATGQLLRVTLQTLGKGVYTVFWRVVSVDSHVTEGQFSFTVE